MDGNHFDHSNVNGLSYSHYNKYLRCHSRNSFVTETLHHNSFMSNNIECYKYSPVQMMQMMVVMWIGGGGAQGDGGRGVRGGGGGVGGGSGVGGGGVNGGGGGDGGSDVGGGSDVNGGGDSGADGGVNGDGGGGSGVGDGSGVNGGGGGGGDVVVPKIYLPPQHCKYLAVSTSYSHCWMRARESRSATHSLSRLQTRFLGASGTVSIQHWNLEGSLPC